MAGLDGLEIRVGSGGGIGGSTGFASPDSAAWADALAGVVRDDGAAVQPGVGFATPIQYAPSRPGYHDYTAGPNVVCPAELRCTPQEMVDQMSRFSLPGQSPAKPIQSGRIYACMTPRPVHSSVG